MNPKTFNTLVVLVVVLGATAGIMYLNKKKKAEEANSKKVGAGNTENV